MFSFVGKLCSFSVTKMKTLGTRSVSSQPTAKNNSNACLSFFLCVRACVWVCVKKYIFVTGVVKNQNVNT